MEKTFNIILTTIGRESITRMVNSIYPQLKKGDYLTIICDCRLTAVLPKITECLERSVCNIVLIQNSEVKGYMGHGSRTFFQNKLFGDYLMNADDDDYYLPDAMESIRSVCKEEKLYIFKMADEKREIPFVPSLTESNIGTPCGVIPNNSNLPMWGERYGGDFDFYNNLSKQVRFEFVDKVIYKIRNS